MAVFEDEMTERDMAHTEAEYRSVTRQEIREQRLADERSLIEANRSAAIASLRSIYLQ